MIRPLALWLALGLAFSPVLAGMVETFQRVPTARGAGVAVLLLALALRRTDGQSGSPSRDGYFGIALGVTLEVVGLATETAAVARLGIPVAVLGLARARGWPPLPIAALSLFAVPVPGTAFSFTSPELERALGRLAAELLQTLGAPIALAGRALEGSAGRIDLTPPDGGLALAPLLAGLVWYAGLRRSWAASRSAMAAALAAVAAPLVQLAGIFVAGGLLSLGFADGGDAWLRHGVWLLTAVGGYWIAEPRRDRGSEPSRAAWASAGGP